MKKLEKIILSLSLIFGPVLLFAQANQNSGLLGIVSTITRLFNVILPLIVSLGVIYFVFGIVQYFIADSEEAKKNGKNRILYGIIGFAVIVSIWGLVAILNQTFGQGGASGLNGPNAPDVSQLGFNRESANSSNSCSLSNSPKFQDLLNYATCIIGNSVIPLIFALAVMLFVWGAVKFFIIEADEEAKRTQGKQFMLWGIIAFAVMISIWGLVKILGSTINVESNFLPQVKPISN